MRGNKTYTEREVFDVLLDLENAILLAMDNGVLIGYTSSEEECYLTLRFPSGVEVYPSSPEEALFCLQSYVAGKDVAGVATGPDKGNSPKIAGHGNVRLVDYFKDNLKLYTNDEGTSFGIYLENELILSYIPPIKSGRNATD